MVACITSFTYDVIHLLHHHSTCCLVRFPNSLATFSQRRASTSSGGYFTSSSSNRVCSSSVHSLLKVVDFVKSRRFPRTIFDGSKTSSSMKDDDITAAMEFGVSDREPKKRYKIYLDSYSINSIILPASFSN